MSFEIHQRIHTVEKSYIYKCSQCEGFHNKTVSQNIPENSHWEGHINAAMMKSYMDDLGIYGQKYT